MTNYPKAGLFSRRGCVPSIGGSHVIRVHGETHFRQAKSLVYYSAVSFFKSTEF
jgi:hypothetical protein